MPAKHPKRRLLPDPDIIFRRGKPVSVILPIAKYEMLLDLAADAADVAYLRRARRKPLRYRRLDEYLAERRRG